MTAPKSIAPMVERRPAYAAAEMLIPADVIAGRVRELGAAIDRDFLGRRPILVTVLLGAFVFAADLVRAIGGPLELGSVRLSSYPVGTERAGRPRLLTDLQMDISGRHVIVVDDIVDSGQTMGALMERLKRRTPASLTAAALLNKPSQREVNVPLRYVGFEIAPAFVVGYGLDHSGLYRNLPYIGVLPTTEQRSDR